MHFQETQLAFHLPQNLLHHTECKKLLWPQIIGPDSFWSFYKNGVPAFRSLSVLKWLIHISHFPYTSKTNPQLVCLLICPQRGWIGLLNHCFVGKWASIFLWWSFISEVFEILKVIQSSWVKQTYLMYKEDMVKITTSSLLTRRL